MCGCMYARLHARMHMPACMCCGFVQDAVEFVSRHIVSHEFALASIYIVASAHADRVSALNVAMAPCPVCDVYREGNPRFDYSYCVGHNGFYDLRLPENAHEGSGARAAVDMRGTKVEGTTSGGVAGQGGGGARGWSVVEVARFVGGLTADFGGKAAVYAENLQKEDVNGEVLLGLANDDLKELGLTLGHRKLMLAHIARLQTETASGTQTPGDELRVAEVGGGAAGANVAGRQGLSGAGGGVEGELPPMWQGPAFTGNVVERRGLVGPVGDQEEGGRMQGGGSAGAVVETGEGAQGGEVAKSGARALADADDEVRSARTVQCLVVAICRDRAATSLPPSHPPSLPPSLLLPSLQFPG